MGKYSGIGKLDQPHRQKNIEDGINRIASYCKTHPEVYLDGGRCYKCQSVVIQKFEGPATDPIFLKKLKQESEQ